MKITPENPNILGEYNELTNDIQLALKQGSSTNQVYEVMIHEGGHALLSNSQVIKLNIKGYENMQAVTAIDIYFENSIGSMKNKYKNLYNQMHDVAVNKISLTNPNIDVDKWYEGFKEDYSDLFNKFNNKELLFDMINNNYQEILPSLAEVKIILEKKGELELVKKIDKVLETIKYSDNSFIYDDFNKIYENYKNIYEGLI
jgi:hypothetical protein